LLSSAEKLKTDHWWRKWRQFQRC